jgi:hypothetical protein
MTLLMVMAALVVPHSEPVAERKLPCVGACKVRHQKRVYIRGYRGKLNRMARCESGGDWFINTGNGYFGGVQFDLQTWRSVGGSGYPHENTKLEQMYRSVRLIKRRGYAPWPTCGSA